MHITKISPEVNDIGLTQQIKSRSLLCSSLHNLHTFTTLSLFNVLAVLTLRSVVTLARPPSSYSLKITDRSFRYASPCLWNRRPLSLRQPRSGTRSSISDSLIPAPITSSSSDSPLCTSITHSLFQSRLKTYPFHKFYPRSFTSSSRTAFTDYCPDRFYELLGFCC